MIVTHTVIASNYTLLTNYSEGHPELPCFSESQPEPGGDVDLAEFELSSPPALNDVDRSDGEM